MTTERHIKLGRQTALISFLLGTVIFVLYFLTSSIDILFLGYGFIVLTGLINIGILTAILTRDFEDALQIFNAESIVGVDFIVTRNLKDFKNGTIPAIAPDEVVELIKRLKK